MTPNILPLLFWLLIARCFVAVIWKPYRQRRLVLVASLGIALSLVHGYASYRLLCSQPLTCDVGNSLDYLPSVSLHFACQAAAGYGVAIAFVAFSQRTLDTSSVSARTAAFGALITIGTYFLVGALLSLVWPWPL